MYMHVYKTFTERMKHYSAKPSAQLPKHMHNALLLLTHKQPYHIVPVCKLKQ